MSERPSPSATRLRRLGSSWAVPLTALARGCGGGLLLDTAVAVMVFTLVGSAVLVGVSTVQSSGAATASQSIAENLARNQMEYIFSLSYQDPPAAYPLLTPPAGYGLTAQADEYIISDTAIEKITVSVTHEAQPVLTLETLRTK